MFGANANPELPRSEELRQVLALATAEAVLLGHPYIGTEHVLLALVGNHDSAITAALAESRITPEKVREAVGNAVRQGSALTMNAEALPLTTRTKNVLSFAEEVARELGHAHVTPEHVLVGLMRERKSIGAQVLQQHGMTIDAAEEIARRAQ